MSAQTPSLATRVAEASLADRLAEVETRLEAALARSDLHAAMELNREARRLFTELHEFSHCPQPSRAPSEGRGLPPCPACDGAGEITDNPSRDPRCEVSGRCPECRGTGVADELPDSLCVRCEHRQAVYGCYCESCAELRVEFAQDTGFDAEAGW